MLSIRRTIRRVPAFTLIELLVVLAMIALVAIWLIGSPAAAKMRDQGRRGGCLANLHELGAALTAYSADNGGLLPMRGGYAYNLKEYETWHLPGTVARKNVRVPVNIGILYGQYVGTDGDVFYCPSATSIRTDPYSGWPTFPLPTTASGVTWSAYSYAAAVPMSGFPRNDGKGCLTYRKHPLVPEGWCGGPDIGCPNYDLVLRDMRTKGENPHYGKVLPLVCDILVGGPTHAEGCNVLFTDFSVRLVPDPTRYIAGQSPTSGAYGQPRMMRAWNFLAKKR